MPNLPSSLRGDLDFAADAFGADHLPAPISAFDITQYFNQPGVRGTGLTAGPTFVSPENRAA